MATLLCTHRAGLKHDTGDYHPECAERLREILTTLEAEEFFLLARDEAPLATRRQLLRAHSATHVDNILGSVPTTDTLYHLDPDTVLSMGSGEAALRAAGAGIDAVDQVARRLARNAFCAVRPPGHHAERDTAMGFCLFNNAAIAALHAREEHGFQRVAVIDFDVHHGNGTQDILWDEPGMFYASTHQERAFPNTGFADETGGLSQVVNVPLPAGGDSEVFRHAYDDIILPKLVEFHPDFLIISAGFDAHASDPLGQMRLRTPDFGWITRRLLAAAAISAGDRVVSVLEGGYDLPALTASVREHVRALMGA